MVSLFILFINLHKFTACLYEASHSVSFQRTICLYKVYVKIWYIWKTLHWGNEYFVQSGICFLYTSVLSPGHFLFLSRTGRHKLRMLLQPPQLRNLKNLCNEKQKTKAWKWIMSKLLICKNNGTDGKPLPDYTAKYTERQISLCEPSRRPFTSSASSLFNPLIRHRRSVSYILNTDNVIIIVTIF